MVAFVGLWFVRFIGFLVDGMGWDGVFFASALGGWVF